MFSIRRFLQPVHIVQPPAAIAGALAAASLPALISSVLVSIALPIIAPICDGADPMFNR